MTEQLENSLRIKVTGICNRNCFFCHQEGGMEGLSEISYSSQLKHIIDTLYQEFNIQSISLTGGEPLLFPGLADLVQSISENTAVKHFSLTTNGTVEKSKDFWIQLQKSGLRKVNVSMPDILMNVPVSNGTSSDLKIFQNQLSTVELLNQIGTSVNINVVVFNDKRYLLNVLNTIFENSVGCENVSIALLPNLTNSTTFNNSQIVIHEILESLKCEKTKLSHRKGTSNTVCDYITADGHHIQVKTTKPNGDPKRLSSLCTNCEYRKECQEGFYGLRLERKNDLLLLRLCLYKSDRSVLYTIDDFLASPVFYELKDMWG